MEPKNKSVTLIVLPLSGVVIPGWIRSAGELCGGVFEGGRKTVPAVSVEIQGGDARYVRAGKDIGGESVEVRLPGEKEFRPAFPPGVVLEIQRQMGLGAEISNPSRMCWHCASLSGEVVEEKQEDGKPESVIVECGFCHRRQTLHFGRPAAPSEQPAPRQASFRKTAVGRRMIHGDIENIVAMVARRVAISDESKGRLRGDLEKEFFPSGNSLYMYEGDPDDLTFGGGHSE